jgi:ABC-type lipoprotein release transport system permease subunit
VQQSAGVQQVGDAVGQMDHTTQQNAALVEESAAAAESLKAQANQLVEAVAVFRLGDAPVQRAHAASPAVVKAAAPAPQRRTAASPETADDWAAF